MPSRQGTDHHRAYRSRSWDSLSRIIARLPYLHAQAKMLSEYALRTRLRATLLVPWPRPRLSSDRAAQTRRDAICSSQAHLAAWAASVARPKRCARRVHPCCNRAEFTPALEAGCSTAASRRCISCVVRDTGRCPLRASLLIKGRMVRTVPRSRGSGLAALIADFCNKIGTTQS